MICGTEYGGAEAFAFGLTITKAIVERSAMKLSISGGGQTKPTIGGRADDHAVCDLINEVQIPVAVSVIRNPAPRVEGDVVRLLCNDLGRGKMAAGCHMPSRSAGQFDGL